MSLTQTHGDEGIYWQVNFERFHLHFRDQAIISAVANKLDQVRFTHACLKCIVICAHNKKLNKNTKLT